MWGPIMQWSAGFRRRWLTWWRREMGTIAFDEGAVLEELKDWLCEKKGYPRESAEEEVESWKRLIGGDFSFEKMVEAGDFRRRDEPQVEERVSESGARGSGASEQGGKSAASSSTSSSDSSSSSSEKEQEKKKRKVEKLEEERSGGFVVVYNRIDRGKLHRAGKKGCWMARRRDFKRSSFFQQEPDEMAYTSRCQICWPRGADDISSSDSEEEAECLREHVGHEGKGIEKFHKLSETFSDKLWAEGWFRCRIAGKTWMGVLVRGYLHLTFTRGPRPTCISPKSHLGRGPGSHPESYLDDRLGYYLVTPTKHNLLTYPNLSY